MKKSNILGIGVIALVLGSIIFVQGQPGSIEDPLVSQSYVDRRINEVLTMVGLNSHGEAIEANFSPAFVPAGHTIIAGEGTEIILRSGTATAFVPTVDGIVNITSGAELFHGASIPANNLIIVPRADGRGVVAQTDAWFIIRGGFSVNSN